MLNKQIAVIPCLYCKFWNRPENWEEFQDIKTGGPYDWSRYSSECSKLPDIYHVEICLEIHGDAYVDYEITTVGTFGCTLGEEREDQEPSALCETNMIKRNK